MLESRIRGNRRIVARAALVACACGVSATPAFSQTNDDTVRLAWVRDEGAEPCPDSAAVQRAVIARVGRDPFRADARTSIDAVVRRANGAFVARFFVRGPDGEPLGNREFSSANERCDAIVETVALALAIVIDPTVALRPDPALVVATTAAPPSVRPAAREAQRRASPAEHRPNTPAPAVDRRPRMTMGASFAAAVGVLPALAPGASIDGEIRLLPWFSTVVGGQWFAEQRARTASSEFRFSFAGAVVSACFAPLASTMAARASVALCLGASIGSTFAAAVGQGATDGGARVWLSALPSVRGQLTLVGPLAMTANVGVAVAGVRASFVEELPQPQPPTLVFEQSLASLVATTGLALTY